VDFDRDRCAGESLRDAVRGASLMVRRRECAVSNHEAPVSASSFETPLTRLLRMRVESRIAPE
jgi:hypothetical protein